MTNYENRDWQITSIIDVEASWSHSIFPDNPCLTFQQATIHTLYSLWNTFTSDWSNYAVAWWWHLGTPKLTRAPTRASWLVYTALPLLSMNWTHFIGFLLGHYMWHVTAYQHFNIAFPLG